MQARYFTAAAISLRHWARSLKTVRFCGEICTCNLPNILFLCNCQDMATRGALSPFEGEAFWLPRRYRTYRLRKALRSTFPSLHFYLLPELVSAQKQKVSGMAQVGVFFLQFFSRVLIGSFSNYILS